MADFREVCREHRAALIRQRGNSPGLVPAWHELERDQVSTPLMRPSDTLPKLVQKFIADVPMKRLGEPEEIGELVLFTCSDACPYMTADTVYVNGGGGWR